MQIVHFETQPKNIKIPKTKQAVQLKKFMRREHRRLALEIKYLPIPSKGENTVGRKCIDQQHIALMLLKYFHLQMKGMHVNSMGL